jgi:hypothetical protein
VDQAERSLTHLKKWMTKLGPTQKKALQEV